MSQPSAQPSNQPLQPATDRGMSAWPWPATMWAFSPEIAAFIKEPGINPERWTWWTHEVQSVLADVGLGPAPTQNNQSGQRVTWLAMVRACNIYAAYHNAFYACDVTEIIPVCWTEHPRLATELLPMFWIWRVAIASPSSETDGGVNPAAAEAFHRVTLPAFRSRIPSLLGMSGTSCQRKGVHPAKADTEELRTAIRQTLDVLQAESYKSNSGLPPVGSSSSSSGGEPGTVESGGASDAAAEGPAPTGAV